MESKKPTFGHGKICYIEVPAADIAASAAFFETVFNWHIRRDNHGGVSFDDGVGQVSGMWVTGRNPTDGCGLIVSIMVDDAAATVAKIEANAGIIVQPIGKDFPEITAAFKDPAGNLWSIYQHRG
ncbi:VOC family protein [Mucilaginibacter gilvus]|uniref:VOC family protein n=1 Tax=Mucilaginibacter gilvus TaxID=2305909 RepID=A0A444MP35_9SPHI|nr:VOC family protein [Mucilaginibacter gilvus]RWY52403.1 VOC family protein [Mucilaginibacter gilvus]